MKYIGCDFHPSFQQIAMLDRETGEMVERRLLHTEEARVFYQELRGPVVVGIETSGNTHWFESLLVRCGHELWIGDAAAIARQEGRKQKHDRRDAALILKLMVENRFPKIWVPTVAERDLRQLLMQPAPPGADADAGEEPVATHCLEPGCAEEVQAVDPGGVESAAGTGTGTLDAATARYVAADAGRVGAEDPASGASGGARSRSSAGGAIAGDASRS